jgi:hypothetical protein
MVIDLPAAYVGLKKASAHAGRQDRTALPRVLTVLAEGHVKVNIEREQRLTLATALKHMPSGTCLVIRDDSGREWYIGPAGQPITMSLRNAA